MPRKNPSCSSSDYGDGAAAALIQVEDLRHGYRAGRGLVWALDGVTLHVAEGEFVAVMGPSGSGKSTLLNIIGCLDRPTAGTYRLGGVDVGRLSADALAAVRNRSIGFVFQSFHLLPRTSALENVELPLIYGSIRARQRHRRALALLERMGLAERAHHMPRELSGGEQQRVAIARALVNEPSVLLADEPTGALDSRTAQEIMAIFQRLNGDGLTIVLVSHDADIAVLASRMVSVRDGRIVADTECNRRIREPVAAQPGPFVTHAG